MDNVYLMCDELKLECWLRQPIFSLIDDSESLGWYGFPADDDQTTVLDFADSSFYNKLKEML